MVGNKDPDDRRAQEAQNGHSGQCEGPYIRVSGLSTPTKGRCIRNEQAVRSDYERMCWWPWNLPEEQRMGYASRPSRLFRKLICIQAPLNYMNLSA